MNTKERLNNYFEHKTEEIVAVAKQAVASHTGIIGEHREKIIDLFLKDILPTKYSVGTGILVGIESQKEYISNQSDIIIWDSFNYPKIKLHGPDLIFAESAKMIIEIKSNFDKNALDDIKAKTKRIKEFVPSFHPTIKDEIWRLDNKIARAVKGKMEMTMMASAPQIAVSVICYEGGKNFSIETFNNKNEIEDYFPDLMLLIDAGKVIAKRYEPDDKLGKGFLTLYNTGEKSLIAFACILMYLLADRDTVSTSPFQLADYVRDIFLSCKKEIIEFPIYRPIPGMEIIN